MDDIEQIKIDLTLKILRGEFSPHRDTRNLPINDELRTFICSISAECAFWYASDIDKKPLDETRTAACKEADCAYSYALHFREPCPETRTSSCRESYLAFKYAVYVDDKPCSETRESAYKDPQWEQRYKEEFEVRREFLK